MTVYVVSRYMTPISAKNTNAIEICSISQPPEVGPIAMPTPETAAQMPIALGRSLAGKMFVRIDQQVPVADPLQLARRRVEFRADGRQRDVEDRVAHRDDEQAERDHAQRLPAPGVRLRLGCHQGLLPEGRGEDMSSLLAGGHPRHRAST